jgi:hypothetical protein
MTKEKLAQLRKMGFEFDEMWDSIATDAPDPEPLLQINIKQKPKDFGDTLIFEVSTNLQVGEKIEIYIYDVDSIFSKKPDEKVDAKLYKTNYTIVKNNTITIDFTKAMQDAAFKDYEFSAAECYIKIKNSKIKDAFSEVFDVEKTKTANEKGGILENKNEECKKIKVNGLKLTVEQKPQFIATVLCETELGNEILYEIAWVYYNRVQLYGFDDKKGIKASTAFREKQPDYKLCSYYLGVGNEYANIKYGNFTIKSYIATKEFKEKKEPKFIKLKAFIEKEIFSANPETCFKDWIGQGYWGDLDMNPDDVNNKNKDPKWYMARQYYWLQLEKKVVVKYVHIMRTGGISTSFIFDEINIAIFFKKNPNLLPAPEFVRKFRSIEGYLNFDL